MKNYDVAIVGAGPGGIYAAYELKKKDPALSVVVLEAGHSLEKRHCPIDGKKIKSCISCKSCSIMSGFGGAGAFSDGKYNITNDFNEPISDDSFELNDNFNLEPETNFDPSLVSPFEETTEAPIADVDTELNMLDASLANDKKAEVAVKEKPIENKDEGIKLT